MNLKHRRGSDLGIFHHLKKSLCRKWQALRNKAWTYYIACHTAVWGTHYTGDRICNDETPSFTLFST